VAKKTKPATRAGIQALYDETQEWLDRGKAIINNFSETGLAKAAKKEATELRRILRRFDASQRRWIPKKTVKKKTATKR
jgi:hypothetical protein